MSDRWVTQVRLFVEFSHLVGRFTVGVLVLALILSGSVSCKKEPVDRKGRGRDTVVVSPPGEELAEIRERNLIILDRGMLSYDQGAYHEGSSIQSRILRFDPANRFTLDVLSAQNPEARWGYIGFLNLTPDGERLLLTSRMLRVNATINPKAKWFNKFARLSVLDARSLQVIRQVDFLAYHPDGRVFPTEVFATDEKHVYATYRYVSVGASASSVDKADDSDITEETYCTLIEPGKDPSDFELREVLSLNGRYPVGCHIVDGIVYAIDATADEEQRELIAFNPADESVTTLPALNPLRIMGWEGDLAFLSYRDGSIALYSVRDRRFLVEPVRFKEIGAIRSVAYDRRRRELYVNSDDSYRRPFIYVISIDELVGVSEVSELPRVYEKLYMLTSDPSSGKVELYVDHLQDKLFVLYFRGERHRYGAFAQVYDLKVRPAPGKWAMAEKSYPLAHWLGDPWIAYSIPR